MLVETDRNVNNSTKSDCKLRFRFLILSVLVICAASAILLSVRIPLCSLSPKEEWLILVGSIAIQVFGTIYFFMLGIQKRSRIVFIVFLMTGVTWFAFDFRQMRLTLMHWQIDGLVIDMRITRNHAGKVIVTDSDGPIVVPDIIWNQISMGDRLQKTYCEGKILINGVAHQVLPNF